MNTGISSRAASRAMAAAERSLAERRSKYRCMRSMLPRQPRSAAMRAKAISSRIAVATLTEGRPERRNPSILLPKLSLMVKVISEVFWPLLFTRSTTSSPISTSKPCSRYFCAASSTSALTARYFSSPTKVLGDFLV